MLRRVRSLWLVAALVSFAFAPVLATGAGDAGAQTVLTVTTTADDGSAGSLRKVIEDQATNADGDVVVLEAGATYELTCAQGGDIDHGDTPLEIQGNGATITMEDDCEERILENGTGTLVLRDVHLTGLDLTLTTDYDGAIVLTRGPLTITGGRVADNTVDAGTNDLGGLLTSDDVDTPVLITGTVFDTNARSTTGEDCGLICSASGIQLQGVTISNTTATTVEACGGIACADHDIAMTAVTISGTHVDDHVDGGMCGGVACSRQGGSMSLVDSTITGTTVTDNECGGIFCNEGAGGFSMTSSSITDTTMTGPGDEVCGAIACLGGDVTIRRSTIARTRAELSGGTQGNDCASIICTSGELSVVDSTIADNTTTGGAGLAGAFGAQSAQFVYATFVGNSGSGLAALVVPPQTGTFQVFGSVLAGSGPGGNCLLPTNVVSHGYNFADDTSCGLHGPGDHQADGADPMLAPLADNGGPGPTMLPLGTSPLVNAVPAEACQANGAAGIDVDERGQPRPSALSPSCDIGAVELQPHEALGLLDPGPEPPAPAPVPVEPTFTG